MCLTCSYLNINWLQICILLYIKWFLFEVFYEVLPLMCAVKVTQSCVDFVLLELFPRINVVLELLRDAK